MLLCECGAGGHGCRNESALFSFLLTPDCRLYAAAHLRPDQFLAQLPSSALLLPGSASARCPAEEVTAVVEERRLSLLLRSAGRFLLYE